jgi:hypothetical protein
LEDHAERPAGKEAVLFPRLLEALQVVGQVEDLEQLLPTPIGDPRERAAFQAVGDRDHSAGSYSSRAT